MKIHRFEVGSMKANCYILVSEDNKESLIVDPGDDAQYLIEKCHELGVRPQAILATHGHFDHILGAYEIQCAFSIGFFMHHDDVFLLDRMQQSAKRYCNISAGPKPHVDGNIKGNDVVEIGPSKGKVIALPGHTPGSIGLWFPKERALLTGDTIFAHGYVGRTDFACSDKTKFAHSLRTVFSLPADTVLFPGHGETTILGDEKSLHDNPG